MQDFIVGNIKKEISEQKKVTITLFLINKGQQL